MPPDEAAEEFPRQFGVYGLILLDDIDDFLLERPILAVHNLIILYSHFLESDIVILVKGLYFELYIIQVEHFLYLILLVYHFLALFLEITLLLLLNQPCPICYYLQFRSRVIYRFL